MDAGGLDRLARGISGGVRDLMGALTFLEAAASEHASEALAEPVIERYLASRREATTPSLATIVVRTARYFALKPSTLRGPSRRRNVALARNVAIYLARSLTGQSFEKIGDYFGGRDHTTALHAYYRIAELGEVDPETQRAISELRSEMAC
jgi:chromosomal replication initiator protein